MITLWGRNNSTNVKKVLWVLEELALPHEQIVAGLPVQGRVIPLPLRRLVRLASGIDFLRIDNAPKEVFQLSCFWMIAAVT